MQALNALNTRPLMVPTQLTPCKVRPCTAATCAAVAARGVCAPYRGRSAKRHQTRLQQLTTQHIRCLLLVHTLGLAAHPHTARRTVAVTVGCATGKAACVPYPPNPNSGVVQQDYQGLAQTGPACANRQPDTQTLNTTTSWGKRLRKYSTSTRPRHYAPTPHK